MECAAQGVIESEYVDALKELLQGLSGNAPEEIKLHELVLRTFPTQGIASSEIRLQFSLLHPNPSWNLRLVGGAMRGAGADQLVALVRNVVETKMSGNALLFFTSLGCILDHELIRTGFVFTVGKTTKLKVSICSVSSLPQIHAVDQAVPVTPGLCLVDVTASATPENYVEVVAAIVNLADNLAPFLKLSKPGVVVGIVPNVETTVSALGCKISKNEN